MLKKYPYLMGYAVDGISTKQCLLVNDPVNIAAFIINEGALSNVNYSALKYRASKTANAVMSFIPAR